MKTPLCAGVNIGLRHDDDGAGDGGGGDRGGEGGGQGVDVDEKLQRLGRYTTPLLAGIVWCEKVVVMQTNSKGGGRTDAIVMVPLLPGDGDGPQGDRWCMR
ncbi:hypothetical protein E2C01_073193 [Portunus trituberculatus]|uniref:Uncharacterized protein n=1 Tax=Portunus trituberculatus TaxID=210409 RepID=A0A5B7I9X6_PORTR|nr:hypothetical protein [Portunus trituberculatus]